jgi:phospholipid/cholesterol/gamma-HCH transport system substrate-binding protein
VIAISSVHKKTISAGIKLTVFAVITIFLTLVLASTIGSVGYHGSTSYRAMFTDVTGLQVGDDVRIAGVREGQVTHIALVDHRTAVATFGLAQGVVLHKDAHIDVRYRNLVGQRYLAVDEGSGAAAVIPSKSTIPESQTSPPLDLSTVLNGFQPLFTALNPADVNKLAYEIIQTLQGEGGTIDTLLAQTASLTSTIADRDQVISSLITNLDSTLATVAQRDSQLGSLVDDLKDLVSGLAQDRNAIGNSLQGIDNLATATAGLLQPARPLIKSTVSQLGTLAGTLDKNKATLDKEITFLPTKLSTLLRTATYGSWFNFFLCGAGGTITLPGGIQVAAASLIKVTAANCSYATSGTSPTGSG